MIPASPSRALRIAAVPMMLLAGAIIAIQSEINGRLAHELGAGLSAGLGAALLNFSIGVTLVATATLSVPRHRAALARLVDAVRTQRIRPVELIGGLFGALVVASQGLTVATIGVALFIVAVTAGQSASSLLVDHLGLGPSGHRRLSVSRSIAAAFAVLAVILATGERLVSAFSWQVAVFALLPLLAGAGTAVQQAFNGRVAGVAGPWVATLNNFFVGFTALTIAFLLSLLGDVRLYGFPDTWWLYLGAPMGVTFIWLASVLVRVHGVLVLGLSLIAGQVIAAEVIEVLILEETHVGPVGIAAGLLTVVGVLVALLVKPREPEPVERVIVVYGPAD